MDITLENKCGDIRCSKKKFTTPEMLQNLNVENVGQFLD